MTLEIDQLIVTYGARRAVDRVSLSLRAGQIVGLIGPNGSGKSSVLKALVGILPSDGKLAWQRADLRALTPAGRARMIGFLPQIPQAHWPLTVFDLVALGRLPHRRFGEAPTAADKLAVHRALEATETHSLAQRNLNQLSGGEAARVQLARALSVEAPILLVDEPIAQLDPFHQLQIMTVLREYAARGGLVVSVMHDLTLAARFCGRIVLMCDGEIAGDGTPDDVLTEDLLRLAYRVDTVLTSHAGEPIIVPWSRCL